MKYSLIDSDNYAAAGIQTMFFPGGEPHVKLPIYTATDPILFFGKLRTWNDVGIASHVLDALGRQAIRRVLFSFIPYFPGARQDRSDGTSALTVDLMNAILGDNNHVFDIHSRSAFDKSWCHKDWYWTDLYYQPQRTVTGVIAPDEGAIARAKTYHDKFHPKTWMLHGSKHRDPVSGYLSHYQITPFPQAGHYVIVDDICDGGGTFNLLVEAALKDPLGTQSTFELVVSHGIFSKGLDALHPKIIHTTTTDSWCKLPNSEKLTVVKLEQLFDRIME